MNKWYPIYAIIFGGGGIALAYWVNRELQRVRQERHDRLEKLRQFDAVRTSSPLDDPNEQARKQALLNVETRFTLFRATLVPVILLLTISIVALPLLQQLPGTMLSLVVAAVGVIVGIAARPMLENFVAGVVISFSRPFRIGDTVTIDNEFGTIEDITVSHTIVKVWDWRRLMIPNSQMISKQFVNYSIIDRYQWKYVEFWVAPDSDLKVVEEIAKSAAKSSPSYANYEEPRFWVMEMGKEGLRCWLAAWADTPSAAWQLSHDIRTRLVADLRDRGVKTHVHRLENAEPRVMG
ncbi:MAG: mechanosensitive ion channel [Phycisphaerales bacterium]|nr:mechanosensitive ion channel [Phycisphaerales bacterium]MCB9857288.1 mechanosensitive ion channel [Phycisphaerales bacterium]MCB9862998.1 mechanosensitive ion channel [Phycisphaerales bacterium]